ncbi:MAG: hypothetical protein BGO12_05655 [Verrucomicrobia bacterium 61-8]|nr:MAG: hypothetical protein BGO12_05655 [Verrucomicrobia bacterium 61-8]
MEPPSIVRIAVPLLVEELTTVPPPDSDPMVCDADDPPLLLKFNIPPVLTVISELAVRVLDVAVISETPLPMVTSELITV